jgi:LemA protein
MPIVAALAAIAAVAWGIAAYNRFVRDTNLVREAWSGIDVQLRMRYDLVPLLVEIVKGYRDHERLLFEQVAAARTRCIGSVSLPEKGAAEGALTRGIRSLFAVAEAYPDLKASDNFLGLQKSLAEVEDRIQLARRYYNGTVREYNIRVESFPGMIVARLWGFGRAEYFEIELATQRDAPPVRV